MLNSESKHQKHTFVLSSVVLLIFIHPSELIWCKWQSFGDICCRDVCLLSYLIELGGTLLVVFKETNKSAKTQQ